MSRTIYYNGTILTMDDMAEASAVVVEDGVIVKVLAGGDAEANDGFEADDCETGGASGKYNNCEICGTRCVDLNGATMMPAFIDPHSHFAGYGMSQTQVPLADATSFDEIVETIRTYIAEHEIPAGAWVTAKGYDHNRLKEMTHPTAEVLDRVGTDHPIILKHQSGHMGVFNTKALEIIGVTPETPCPSGGLIEVRDGKVTGYMEENAFIEFQQHVPASSLEEYVDAAADVQEKYASYGIATVQEGNLHKMLVPIYQQLDDQKRLTLDVVAYVDYDSADATLEALKEHCLTYKNHLKVGGIKIFLDGSPQGRTAWVRKPYEGGEPDYTGYPVLTDEDVEDRVRYAARHGLQILAHCNGDAAAAQYIRACRKITEEGHDLHKIRPVMVHGQLLGLDQLAEVKELGIVVSFFVAHVWHWGDTHLRNFGYERGSHISPAGSALKMGIPFTFHQDCPVLDPNMLETVWCSVKRQTREGKILDAEAIPVLEALKAVTANAAWQYFEEDTKGTIAPGKVADFVILEKNPLTVPVDEIRTIRILETIKGGKTIYENRG